MSITPTKIGVIGCGNISGAYLSAGKKFEILQIAACADLDMERARAKAEEFGVPVACTVQELLADPSIEIVVNLTIPKAHAEVAMAVIAAGKSVYNEKPLAITREDGRRMLDAAQAKGVRVGCAPDTFLGGGIQTCRKLIDDGAIGTPIAATAFMMCHGHESWHPDPEFYYKLGGGPMFDMGPYYLTALVNLIGAVRRVTGSTRVTFPERTITSQPKSGHQDHRRCAHPCRRRARFRQRRHRHDHHQLRCLARAVAAHRDLRHGRHLERARPELLRRSRQHPARAGRGVERGCRSPTATRTTTAASAWRIWPTPCAAGAHTAPAAPSPSTCSTSCTPSTTPPATASTSNWSAA